ncbi:MAG: hypothetical protein JL50_01140 [Peptococcaceae bacterium BICA1-7]|nr:MAG: hypothetical protein JL50_01140 [Peptococcaceae bacterium BICA1-7]HBV98006.1 hypothetical protein [Desulfotomaculum sp.]
MPRLLAATRITPLDQFLLNNEELRAKGFEVVVPSFENIYDLTGMAAGEAGGSDSTVSPPVIVLSSMTSGKGGTSAEEALYGLRALGYRVVLLPGDPVEESTKLLVRDAVRLGIYDFVYDPYTGDNVVFRLLNPATLADVDLEGGGEEESGEKSEDTGAGAGGVVKRLAGKVSDFVQLPKEKASPEPEESGQATKAKRKSKGGKLIAVLGIGDTRIEEWVAINYGDKLQVHAARDPDEFRQRVEELEPDICMLMRESVRGGITDADGLAAWAKDYASIIMLLAGELDAVGKDMVARAREAGIRHIISCEAGGQLSGDDFNWVLTGIIRELQESGNDEDETDKPLKAPDAKKALSTLLKGTGQVIKKTAFTMAEGSKEKPVKKKIRPKINRHEGISLENSCEQVSLNQSLKNPTSVVQGGILAIVSPFKPNIAGRLSAQAVRVLGGEGGEVVYIGVAHDSTGAVWMDIDAESLMMSDWRVPGSNTPIRSGNTKIYAVDPFKNIAPDIGQEFWIILKEIRKSADYIVLDLGGDISLAAKVSHQGRAVVLVVIPGNDPVEQTVSEFWLKNLAEGKNNIVTGIDLRGVPAGIPDLSPSPKVVIRNNPADALSIALRKKTDGEFHWI